MSNLETRVENLEYSELKATAALINDVDLEGIDKLRIVGVAKPKMVENFAAVVESIAAKHGEEHIPEKALLLFNDLFGGESSRLDASPEPVKEKKPEPEPEKKPEPVPEKKPEPEPERQPSEPEKKPEPAPEKKTKPRASKPKVEKDTTENPPVYEVDKYGTRPDTLARCFIESLQAEPKTMDEVMKESWNPKGFIFPRTVERLVSKGLATVDDRGIISLTE